MQPISVIILLTNFWVAIVSWSSLPTDVYSGTGSGWNMGPSYTLEIPIVGAIACSFCLLICLLMLQLLFGYIVEV